MIKIKADVKTIQDSITVDELLLLQTGDIPVIVGALSKFIVDEDGNALTPEDGRKALGKLTITQLVDAAKVFTDKLSDGAVPPLSAAS